MVANNNIIDPRIAASAYARNTNVGTGISNNEDKVSFTDFLKDETQEAINTLKTSEKMSAMAITGKADITDVVEAVNAAEITLETARALRDRMIGAYQELMRTQI